MNIENELLKLVNRAKSKNEVPIAAVIVKDGKILSKAYNLRESKRNPLYHAEILSIMRATKKIDDWRLNDCDLYVTLFPCKMCQEVIKEARLRNVYYYLEPVAVLETLENYIRIDCDYNCVFKKELVNFFELKR